MGFATVATSSVDALAESQKSIEPIRDKRNSEQPKTDSANYFEIDETITLSEVSVLLYGTVKKWSEIAKWNQIKPPYTLKFKRRLVLNEKPTLTREQGRKELLSMRSRLGHFFNSDGSSKSGVTTVFNSSTFNSLYPSSHSYLVTVNYLTLAEVSLIHYGTHKKWMKIAKWNQLEPPFVVKTGQRLALQDEPTLTEEQGLALLKKERATRYEKRKAVAHASIQTNTEKSEGVTPPETSKTYEEIRRSIASVESHSHEKNYEELFDEGKSFFQQQKFDEALKLVKSARSKNSEFLPAQFLEFKILKAMNRTNDSEKAKSELLDHHPEFKELPLFSAQ